MPTESGEDVERGPPSSQDPPVVAEHMDGTLARRSEFPGHGRIRNGLIRLRVEAPGEITPPDPGGQASSEAAVAVPKHEFSITHRALLSQDDGHAASKRSRRARRFKSPRQSDAERHHCRAPGPRGWP